MRRDAGDREGATDHHRNTRARAPAAGKPKRRARPWSNIAQLSGAPVPAARARARSTTHADIHRRRLQIKIPGSDLGVTRHRRSHHASTGHAAEGGDAGEQEPTPPRRGCLHRRRRRPPGGRSLPAAHEWPGGARSPPPPSPATRGLVRRPPPGATRRERRGGGEAAAGGRVSPPGRLEEATRGAPQVEYVSVLPQQFSSRLLISPLTNCRLGRCGSVS
jgi:hypothetical protein